MAGTLKMSLYPYSRTVQAMLHVARINGTAVGVTVDKQQGGTADYQTVMFVISSDTITDGSHAISIQDSPDGTTWTNAAPADVQGTAPTLISTSDDLVFDLGYRGQKRYVRVQAVTTTATTGGVFGAAAVLFDAAGWRR